MAHELIELINFEGTCQSDGVNQIDTLGKLIPTPQRVYGGEHNLQRFSLCIHPILA